MDAESYQWWCNKLPLYTKDQDGNEIPLPIPANPDFKEPTVEEAMDKEVFGRFTELIILSNDFVFRYNYSKGTNGCKASKGDLISLRALAVLLALSGRCNETIKKQLIKDLGMKGITLQTLTRYIRLYKRLIKKQYNTL